MIGRWIALSLIVSCFAGSAADAGVLGRKPKSDAQRVRVLIETLRTDADESKRRAAVAELGDYDPKGDVAILSALIGVLQRDQSEAVRAEAASVLGEIKPYSTQAGLALERTAESDRSLHVKSIAREALWEYHLNGYRSQKIAEMVMFQTAEPPLAKTNSVRTTGGVVPMPSIVISPESLPVAQTTPSVPATPIPTVSLPPLVTPPGMLAPFTAAPTIPTAPTLIQRPNFPLNRTDEPPLARKRPSPLAPTP